MKIGIALHHHAAVRVVFAEHVRAGADRIPVEREVFLGHSRLRVKAVGLARHRRKKRHRQPIDKLRILAMQANPVGITIDPGNAFQRKAIEIKPILGMRSGFGA